MACQPKQTWEMRPINGSPLPNGGIIVLLDHHLTTADSLFTIKTVVEALGQKISDNKFEGEKNEDINRALTWQPECLLRGK